MITCTCPVCGQTGEYADRYAGKWHRCIAGCARYPGTRMIVVAGGRGLYEGDLDAGWRRALTRGRALRWLGALVALAVGLAPAGLEWSGRAHPPRHVVVGAGAAGLIAAALVARSARSYWLSRPPGL